MESMASIISDKQPKIKKHGVVYNSLNEDIDFRCTWCGCEFTKKLKYLTYTVWFQDREELIPPNTRKFWRERVIDCATTCPECKRDVRARYKIVTDPVGGKTPHLERDDFY